jgi:drug/metabolite transporter (DMT)-like permease
MAGYLAVARELGAALDPLALTAHSARVAALLLGLAVLTRATLEPIALPSAEGLGWIALSALVPQVIGHTALTYALRGATPTEVGLATALEPVLSTVLAWLWLSEAPPQAVLAGCGVTLAGVLLGALPGGAPRAAGAAAGATVTHE